MILFLAIQNTYTSVEIALMDQEQILEYTTLDKTMACKQLILALDDILKKRQYSMHDLSFIAVNQGPGPFTTLRVVIATINGLGFATKLPLIGVDGLDALLAEYDTKSNSITVALLNAFHHDVYYAIKTQNLAEKGYENIEQLLHKLIIQFPQKQITFIGSGALLYKAVIEDNLGTQATIITTLEYASLKQIALQGLQQWQQGAMSTQLMPLYLKRAFYTQ